MCSLYSHFENPFKIDGVCDRDTLSWENVQHYSIHLPELSQTAKDLIQRRVGYHPKDAVLFKYEPYLRTLIDHHRKGLLSDNDFQEEAENHMKDMRNYDIRHHSWDKPEHCPEEYEAYKNYLPLYINQARARVEGILGYAPDLKYSLMAEVKLRELFDIGDIFTPDNEYTSLDFLVLTAIRYREFLLDQGREAADSSPLSGFAPFFVDDHQSIFGVDFGKRDK